MHPRFATLPLFALLGAMLPAQKPAAAPAKKPDPAEVKKALAELQTDWPKWLPPQRAAALDRYTALGSPEVAVALAHKLTDPSASQRIAIAKALGTMKEPKAIPQLAAAMDREEAAATPDLDAFAALCKALGDIGDPAAIPALVHHLNSGDRQKPEWLTKAQARLEALGSIRHVQAIDELIDQLGRTGASSTGRGNNGNRRVGQSLARTIEGSLRRLTGGDAEGEKGWRDWWRSHRATFKF